MKYLGLNLRIHVCTGRPCFTKKWWKKPSTKVNDDIPILEESKSKDVNSSQIHMHFNKNLSKIFCKYVRLF